MDILKKYERKWIEIDEYNFSKITLGKLDKTLLINPLKLFPKRIVLSEKEQNQLLKLERKESWNGEAFLQMVQLQKKRGISKEDFHLIQKDLNNILQESQNKGLIIPKWFVTFFSSYDFLSRFRFGDIGFRILDEIIPFPECENYYLIPFLGDSQGFYWWHLLINTDSNYCIVYRDLHWQEYPTTDEPKEYGQYYICSDTFEEFLIRLSMDMNEKKNEY